MKVEPLQGSSSSLDLRRFETILDGEGVQPSEMPSQAPPEQRKVLHRKQAAAASAVIAFNQHSHQVFSLGVLVLQLP
ncbi:hypothetical protein GUJ93_ZPchr0010g8723 [Zizania palustris]|uniref:Uncharacterized protein n=1 Tax=Zizania palustris TaxID=103762 RepID=A0A8J5WFC5_ZIZPA|nr:hypothetical protein GUJ93_ZPchr0010g8723 [Zizania palustris]